MRDSNDSKPKTKTRSRDAISPDVEKQTPLTTGATTMTTIYDETYLLDSVRVAPRDIGRTEVRCYTAIHRDNTPPDMKLMINLRDEFSNSETALYLTPAKARVIAALLIKHADRFECLATTYPVISEE